jgi:small subunit ribosomal protein S21
MHPPWGGQLGKKLRCYLCSTGTNGRGGHEMTSVVRRENETIEDALKRFKRELRKVGVLREARKHEHYEKPSEIKKRKKAASVRNKHKRAD